MMQTYASYRARGRIVREPGREKFLKTRGYIAVSHRHSKMLRASHKSHFRKRVRLFLSFSLSRVGPGISLPLQFEDTENFVTEESFEIQCNVSVPRE